MASSGVGVQGRMALPLHQNHILVTHSRRVAGQESMLDMVLLYNIKHQRGRNAVLYANGSMRKTAHHFMRRLL